MDITETESVNILPYVGAYILMLFILTVASVILLIVFPSLPQSFAKAVGIGINFGATTFAYQRFVRKHLRLFNRKEYWKIVAFSTLAACLLSVLQGSLAFEASALPAELSYIPAVALIGVLVFAALMIFILNAFGYRDRFGNIALKTALARKLKADTEAFR